MSFSSYDPYAMLRVPTHVRDVLTPIARAKNRTWSQHARHILERYAAQVAIEQGAQKR
jgi:hypothetical protein